MASKTITRTLIDDNRSIHFSIADAASASPGALVCGVFLVLLARSGATGTQEPEDDPAPQP